MKVERVVFIEERQSQSQEAGKIEIYRRTIFWTTMSMTPEEGSLNGHWTRSLITIKKESVDCMRQSSSVGSAYREAAGTIPP